jgi:hypothetical protein
MIFDLKSGKRRRVVQVVFGFLAAVFFISFVGFGIGSDAAGGIFDALGIGGGSSSDDPQFEQQIEDAQAAVEKNPGSGNANADLISAYYGSASSSGVSTDQQSGQISITEDAHSDLQRAAQAWDDYLATKPNPVSVTAAASAVRVFQLLNDAGGAAEAQQVIADEQKSAAAYGQLAFYLYADLKIPEGDEAAKQAVAAADGTTTKQIQKTMDSYREQALKFQKQIKQQRQQEQQQGGGGTPGGSELENPFGSLGGDTGATTVPPTSP